MCGIGMELKMTTHLSQILWIVTNARPHGSLWLWKDSRRGHAGGVV